MARHHGHEPADEPGEMAGDQPGYQSADGPGVVSHEGAAPIGSSAGEPQTDLPDANPLSAAGLWDDERPPRMVRPPQEEYEADAVGAAAAAGHRSMVHGPDGRGARNAATTPSRRPRDPVRTTVRGLGQLLITAGVVVLLFVVYELWITNIFGGHRQAEATEALDKLWATEQVTVTQGGAAVVTGSEGAPVVSGGPTLTNQGSRTRHYDTTEGSGFAKLYIPSFGADFVFTVIEGTDENDLYSGPGHYLGTQYPGDPGNFSMAGHRVNKGAPFNDLDLLNPCDAIVVETIDSWYVYRMLPTQEESAGWSSTAHQHCDGVEAQTGQYAGVYGREITNPSDYQQVLPVPHVNSTNVPADAESLITLTTCNPKFSDAQRMIIHGVLVKSYPRTGSFLPPELGETT